MELSSKAFLTSCQIDPSSMKPTAEVVNTKATGFASTLVTTNWSIPQDLALASTRSSNHLKYLPVGESNSYDDFCTVHARKLKGFREILLKVSEDKFEALLMVDAIQRLGIDYHFQRQIESILERHTLEFDSPGDNDLHEVALRFRLLRQEGLYVPAEVFDKFKDERGNFRCNPFGDLMGVMSLYEASQLSIRGEDTLDDARDYTYQLLNSSLTNFDHGQARLVRDTLDHPHHKSLAKFTAKNFFRHLQETNWWTKELKEVAMFDFKMVQSQHQQEIAAISRRWKDLGLSKKLPAARDQPLKWYTWSMACLTDPILSEERIELTKPISFIYIIDDIFDVCGTLDELMLFTQVVNRWDMDAAERLPDYMQICFKALDNITNEIGYRVYNKHGWSPVESFRKAWGRLCSAFLVEAQWFASGQLPKAEEYLKNGITSSGVHVVLVHIFFLLGQGLNKGNAQMVDNNPEIISSTAAILRLWDDLGSAEDEDQDGHDGSYIKYYMNEHPGSSLEGARRHVTSLISDAWKQLNQECLSPNPFSPTFTKAALNLARMVPLMYNYDHNHRLPTLEEHVKSLITYDASVPL